jgi:hypothetical protein
LRVIRTSFLLAVLSGAAAGSAPSGPASPGKLLFEDDFARSELPPKWKIGKGFFEVKDGILRATENPEDHHGAYAYVKPSFQFKDLMVEYSVKLEGAQLCHLLVDDSAYKESHAGHILRATILKGGEVELADFKTGSMRNEYVEKMKDPQTTDEEKRKLRDSVKDKLAAFKVDADLSQWHTVRVEMVGDEMTMSVDDKPAAYLKSAGLDHATKNAIGFTVRGKSALIRSVKMWEASPSDAWPARRDEFVASLRRRSGS